MEEESRLIKLMANFPACDLREVYFQRWKEIFSEAVEFEKELQALRSWKEQRLKDTDPKIEHLVQTLAKKVEELEAWKEKARPYIEERLDFLQNCLEEASGPIDEGFEVELKELEELSELTELLGE